MKKEYFGKTAKGEKVYRYTISEGELTVKILDYGCTIQSIIYDGVDVALGYKRVSDYENNEGYLGATIGRYGNRIAEGKFTLGGKTFTLNKNEKEKQTLHGGFVGYDRQMWAFDDEEYTDNSVAFSLTDRGEETGFPGDVQVTVTFTVQENALLIDYFGMPTEDTPINMTNHCYFNLAGAGKGDILDHKLTLFASYYLPVDDDLIPTGVLRKTAGTPFDFANAKPIGRDIGAEDKQLVLGGGYDHNFCIDGDWGEEELIPHAQVYCPRTGIYMTVFSDQPGVQLYTGNVLKTSKGKGTLTGYKKHGGFCLETQHYPDSPNHPQFPSTISLAKHVYQQQTVYSFTKEGK